MGRFSGKAAAWGAKWRGVPFERKAAVTVLVLGGVLVGGWLAADSLGSASAGTAKASKGKNGSLQTIERVITVHTPAKVVTDRVRVVQKVYVHAKKTAPPKTKTVVQTRTSYDTSTVYRPVAEQVTRTVTGPTRTVTEVQTTTVPKIEWRVVTVEKPVTVTVTTPGP